MTHDLVSWLRACVTNEPSNDDAAKLWGAADLIESLRADLAEQKAAHGACIKRNIALTGENDALRAERDEIRKSHQKMHRRCQQSERVEILTIGVLEGWYDFLNSGERRNRQDRLLFRWAIRDMRRKAAAIRNMGERE